MGRARTSICREFKHFLLMREWTNENDAG